MRNLMHWARMISVRECPCHEITFRAKSFILLSSPIKVVRSLLHCEIFLSWHFGAFRIRSLAQGPLDYCCAGLTAVHDILPPEACVEGIWIEFAWWLYLCLSQLECFGRIHEFAWIRMPVQLAGKITLHARNQGTVCMINKNIAAAKMAKKGLLASF